MGDPADRRVAVVTGAASGIGRATTELLESAGYGVIAVDLPEAPFDWIGERTAIVAVPGDVTEESSNAAMIAAALDHFGRVDVAVLNAGAPGSGPIETLDMAVFDRTMEINVRAVALGIRAAIPAMKTGGGSIVITASTAGLGGETRRWPYNAAKAAVINLMRSAAIDLAHHRIRVNAVCPGPTHSAMTAKFRDTGGYDELRRMIPLQRWGEPGEVAAAIAFLASPEASYITGVALPVDGGITAGNGHSLPPQLP